MMKGSIKMNFNKYLEMAATYNYKAIPILPMGSTDLTTGQGTHFNVLDHFHEGRDVVLLEKNGKYKAVFGGRGSLKNPGEKLYFRHDQTGASFGMWEVVFIKPVSKESFKSIMNATGLKKIQSAVFK